MSDRIYDFLHAKGEELVGKLEKALPPEHQASGELIKSIRFDIRHTGNGGYTFDLYLADYYKYVDEGRQPGTRPPIQALMKWIEVKRLVIHPKYGLQVQTSDKKLKQISDDQKLLTKIAWAMSTNILKHGIRPTNFFSATVPPWIEELKRDIKKELGQYVVSEIRKLPQP